MAKNVDVGLIKKAHAKESFTEEQVKDLLECSDPEIGYLYFIKNFFYIQHPIRGKMLLAPYEFQTRLLASYHKYRYSVNILPRQSGKCVKNNTIIKIKHQTTGEIKDVTIEEFFNSQQLQPTNEN